MKKIHNPFIRGTKLKTVIGPECSGGDCFFASVDISDASTNQVMRAKSIFVVLIDGHMTSVPWARCEMQDGRVIMANLALMETVELLEDES